MKRVLIIGGYGSFGSFIVRRLATEHDIRVVVAGRSDKRAKALADEVQCEWAPVDVRQDLESTLKSIAPNVVIHTSGPFQGQDYGVVRACIRRGAHYIDLSDGRDFVTGIVSFDVAAKQANVLVVSGASSVPALTAAIVDAHVGEFQRLEVLNSGIATAQRTARGLATTRAVLSYVGKPFNVLTHGRTRPAYGWQDLTWRKFAGLGWRALGNCDVPDLTLFPARYPDVQTVRFQAGIEIPLVHLILWGMSWFVRFGLINNLAPIAHALIMLSRPFDMIGSANSGFFMEMLGQGTYSKRKRVLFELVARSGDGAMIPCAPAIALTLKLVRGEISVRGATPCVGLLTMDDILQELSELDVNWTISRN